MAFDYFTLAELRALPDMSNETRFPTERCMSAAAAIVATIEREVGTSFVSRTVTEYHDGGGYELALDTSYVLGVDSVSVNDGTPVTSGFGFRDGVLTLGSGTALSPWSRGYGNIAVTYRAGYSSTPPADVKEQALQGTRAYLLENDTDAGSNARKSSISSEQGTISLVMAGEDRPTGFPSVDAMINAWKAKLGNDGFA